MNRQILSIASSLAAITFAAATAFAQSGSPGEGGTWLIRGGTVVTGTGERLANTNVLIRNGRIDAIGANANASDAKVINAAGKFVYPGMIDTYTPIGLVEIGGVTTMTMRSEMGDFKPHIRALPALNVESEFLGVTRANGVTSVITAPTGGIIAGQAALINTAGWTWEDLAVKANAAYIISLPGGGGGGGGGGGRGAAAAPAAGPSPASEFQALMRAAEQYNIQRANGATKIDLVLEAMRPLIRREVPAIIAAGSEQQIRQAIELGDTYNIRVIIQGGAQAWRVRTLLAQKNIPVLLSSIQSTPGAASPYDEIYAQPGVLNEAGVKFAFSTGGGSNSRHVPLHAALAVAYGLPLDAALKALTIWPAEMFGADKEIGSVTAGKMANLMVTTGDPLDLRTQITEIFIKGRRVPADDKHSRLYQKYNSRPPPM